MIETQAGHRVKAVLVYSVVIVYLRLPCYSWRRDLLITNQTMLIPKLIGIFADQTFYFVDCTSFKVQSFKYLEAIVSDEGSEPDTCYCTCDKAEVNTEK